VADRTVILTTAHWPGDPRLNRHVRYLEAGGWSAEIIAFESSSRSGRARGLFRVLGFIWRRNVEAVILPDPELFVLGSLVGRARGVKVAIDIHEDYGKAAASRLWIPAWMRPFVGRLARWNDRLGRRLADVTLVAAPELAHGASVLVRNIPDPAEFKVMPASEPAKLVYVGDVTESRGAFWIAQLARDLPHVQVVVVGRVGDELRKQMEGISAGGQLRIRGRLSHEKSWVVAGGAVAGLSLLQPSPAYLEAVATKLWEYCAAGIPPIVSNLPGQSRFASRISADLVIDGVGPARQVIQRLVEDEGWASEVRRRSRAVAEEDWATHRPDRALQEAMPLPMT
jgi:hypothetical protein